MLACADNATVFDSLSLKYNSSQLFAKYLPTDMVSVFTALNPSATMPPSRRGGEGEGEDGAGAGDDNGDGEGNGEGEGGDGDESGSKPRGKPPESVNSNIYACAMILMSMLAFFVYGPELLRRKCSGAVPWLVDLATTLYLDKATAHALDLLASLGMCGTNDDRKHDETRMQAQCKRDKAKNMKKIWMISSDNVGKAKFSIFTYFVLNVAYIYVTGTMPGPSWGPGMLKPIRKKAASSPSSDNLGDADARGGASSSSTWENMLAESAAGGQEDPEPASSASALKYAPLLPFPSELKSVQSLKLEDFQTVGSTIPKYELETWIRWKQVVVASLLLWVTGEWVRFLPASLFGKRSKKRGSTSTNSAANAESVAKAILGEDARRNGAAAGGRQVAPESPENMQVDGDDEDEEETEKVLQGQAVCTVEFLARKFARYVGIGKELPIVGFEIISGVAAQSSSSADFSSKVMPDLCNNLRDKETALWPDPQRLSCSRTQPSLGPKAQAAPKAPASAASASFSSSSSSSTPYSRPKQQFKGGCVETMEVDDDDDDDSEPKQAPYGTPAQTTHAAAASSAAADTEGSSGGGATMEVDPAPTSPLTGAPADALGAHDAPGPRAPSAPGLSASGAPGPRAFVGGTGRGTLGGTGFGSLGLGVFGAAGSGRGSFGLVPTGLVATGDGDEERQVEDELMEFDAGDDDAPTRPAPAEDAPTLPTRRAPPVMMYADQEVYKQAETAQADNLDYRDLFWVFNGGLHAVFAFLHSGYIKFDEMFIEPMRKITMADKASSIHLNKHRQEHHDLMNAAEACYLQLMKTAANAKKLETPAVRAQEETPSPSSSSASSSSSSSSSPDISPECRSISSWEGLLEVVADICAMDDKVVTIDDKFSRIMFLSQRVIEACWQYVPEQPFTDDLKKPENKSDVSGTPNEQLLAVFSMVYYTAYIAYLTAGRICSFPLSVASEKVMLSSVFMTGQPLYQTMLWNMIGMKLRWPVDKFIILENTFCGRIKNEDRYMFTDEMQEMINRIFKISSKTAEGTHMVNRASSLTSVLMVRENVYQWKIRGQTGSSPSGDDSVTPFTDFHDGETRRRSSARDSGVRLLIKAFSTYELDTYLSLTTLSTIGLVPLSPDIQSDMIYYAPRVKYSMERMFAEFHANKVLSGIGTKYKTPADAKRRAQAKQRSKVFPSFFFVFRLFFFFFF